MYIVATRLWQGFDKVVQGCDNFVWQCCSQPCDKVVEISEMKIEYHNEYWCLLVRLHIQI